MMNTPATATHGTTDTIPNHTGPASKSTAEQPKAATLVKQGLLHIALVVTSSALLGAACGWVVAMLLSSPGP